MGESTATITRLRATQIDGRTGSIRYRQEQLSRLHHALTSNATEIKQALKKDSGNHDAEIEIEFAMALACLREHYSSLDLDEALQKEYSVCGGEDFSDRRVGVGLVVIQPSSHTPLYSIVSALCAAMAAGNCLLLELSNNLLEVPALLKKLLLSELDNDSFGVVLSPIDTTELETTCVRVSQTGSSQPSAIALLSHPTSTTIAIVDRTADLASAAMYIVRSRFSFGGKSPYAPDIVLVNEFVKKEFLEILARQAIRYLSDTSSSVLNAGNKVEGPIELTAELKSDRDAKIVLLGDQGSIVDFPRKRSANAFENNELSFEKIAGKVLRTTTVTSLDDAIDFVNSRTTQTPYLAVYNFGNAKAVKYLGQSIDAVAAFMNHIPTELLVGPPAPHGHPIDTHLRYTRAMFEVPRPQYVQVSEFNKKLDSILDNLSVPEAFSLEATAPLEPFGKPVPNTIGFFEQGILTGLTIVGVPIISGLVAAAYYGGRAVLSRAR